MKRFNGFCIVHTATEGHWALSDEKRTQEKRTLEGTPEFYREKADSMLKQAQAVQSYEARAELLKLAEQWERLARIVGHPNW
jgi:hypothetical protein